jgi:hypothetical protein
LEFSDSFVDVCNTRWFKSTSIVISTLTQLRKPTAAVLVAVISQRTQLGFQRRNAIRQSWLLYAQDRDVKAIFIVGQARCILNDTVCAKNETEARKRLHMELSSFGDVVEVECPDDYANLLCKTMAIFSWANKHNFGHLIKVSLSLYFSFLSIITSILVDHMINN